MTRQQIILNDLYWLMFSWHDGCFFRLYYNTLFISFKQVFSIILFGLLYCIL